MQMPFCPKLWDRSAATTPAQAGNVVINGTVVVANHFGLSAPGRSTTLRLFSGTQVDHETRKGRLSAEAALRGGKKSKHGKASTTTYQVTFLVDADFGTPGAVAVKNGNRSDQFFLRHVRLDLAEDRSVHFDCNSWVYPSKKTSSDRLFFINTSYLPGKTPEALRLLREEELRKLRGDGRGERKEWERVYDFDYYNDLGNPEKDDDHVRPVLGGTMAHPYPRRCRTGRPLSKADGVTETRRHKLINLDYYIPPDERFSPGKLAEVLAMGVQAVTHFVVPEARAIFHGDVVNFKSLDQLRGDLYSKPPQPAADGRVMDELKSAVPSHKTYKQVAKMVKDTPVKFPIPQVIQHDKDAWRSDEEFAREMLAGLNPVVIKRLEAFPLKNSTITPEHIKSQLEGLTIEQAVHEKRMYILDHHDYLMPYLRRINTLGVCIYASRTLLFLKNDGALKPVAIELSLPGDGATAGGEDISRVFVPASRGTEAHLWLLAKTHVSVNDSGYHQLISHWLLTHATVEPFIIAARRQLSAMHPIHKLLEPHFKDNMQINTLARSILLSAGGLLERTMYPGKYAMQMSSDIYANWRFTDQSLPNDLIKRGMASKDERARGGVSLHIQDYPYAVDGLDVWLAIEGWVRSYCSHFYHTDGAVAGDAELQAWWDDVRHVGHGDRRGDAACWLELDTVGHLAESLTTLIWVASALHAAVNFGQYGYAGFPPNRPTRCRRFVPLPGSPEMAQLEADPERFFLEAVTDRFTATLGLALIEVLSNHTSDEVYLGQRATSKWTDEGEVLLLLDRFRHELRQVEKKVEERNRDPLLKNRRGPATVPYTLLYPDVDGHDKGITGKGIPNSVSI
ncbi:probable linoleate 9S-lipoxygenase 5 [Oryza brachyantha]|uniref:probable linoleate 9S-lipoxygenase 5 n=1 Tax=Oryza brachyantha TaxID=4533 RepID=UPI001ADCB911|nr:probable linoleate 9S-lipoxygenase 5 [Oryza brachyantha]XP_040380211.1 probable linoleate 9S-lipoxygenase 5 [Oryza brachyantha]